MKKQFVKTFSSLKHTNPLWYCFIIIMWFGTFGGLIYLGIRDKESLVSFLGVLGSLLGLILKLGHDRISERNDLNG